MVIVEGTAKLASGEVDRLRPVLTRMVAETVKEAGCHSYAFAADLADPDLLRVIEKWQDDAALAAHFATPHMAEFNAALAQASILSLSVKAYTAEFSRTLMGE